MASEARNSSEAKSEHIKTLKRFIYGEAGLIGCLIALCFFLSREMTCWVPPDISEGGNLNTRTIPDVYIHAFAEMILKKVYLWETDGNKDFPSNIVRYQNYITPSCRKYLETEYQTLVNEKQILKRTRFLRPSSEQFD